MTVAGGTGLDTSASNQTITFSMDLNELSAVTSVADADQVALVDATDNSSKKMTRAHFLGSSLAAFSNGLTSTTISGSSTLQVGGVSTFAEKLEPLGDDYVDLGSSSKQFKDLYLDGVAYIDSLQADQLGAALDANNQAITNVDINSGAIDGTVIGAASQAAGSFTTVSGSGAATFNGSVTTAGKVLPLTDGVSDLGSSDKEFKDLYIDGVAYIDSLQADQLGAALDANSQAITNINVDSGAIDGTVIGANSQAAGEVTTVSGSGAATFDGSVTTAGNVLPLTDGASDLGSSSKEFKDLYLDGVAYIDDLRADQLGAALDANSQAITNINVDSGAVDGITLGTNSAVTNAVMTIMTASHARITNLDAVTINSVSQTEQTLEISDKLIVASLSASSANSAGGGLRIGGGAGSESGHASVLYDHGNTALDFNIAVGGSEVTQVRLQDGVFRPETDNDVDLGASGAEFKDLYLDGVAYIDSLQADQLGAALDANDQAITNVDINSGAIDGTTVGASSQSSGKFTTISGSSTLHVVGASSFGAAGYASISAAGAGSFTSVSGSGVATFNGNVTSAGKFLPLTDGASDLGSSSKEFKDLYLDGVAYIDDLRADQLGAALDANSQAITNINVDSGAIDGTVIGANSQAAAQFTTVSGSGAAQFGSSISMLNGALVLKAGSAASGIANDSGQAVFGISSGQNGAFQANLSVSGQHSANSVIINSGYGSGGASFSSDGSGSLAGQLEVGVAASEKGGSATFHGQVAGEKAFYSHLNNVFQVTGSSASGLQVSIGGDATSEFALDVANGANNINKVRAAAFVTYSDESLKSDVATMSTALDTVMSLNGVEFTWKDSGERDFGFIAQDVQSVIPEAVHVASNGVQGVDYSRLTSVLVEAVKAQQVQIEDLKKTITNLKK